MSSDEPVELPSPRGVPAVDPGGPAPDVRELVELPPPQQVAKEAFNRARSAARDRGARPGVTTRSPLAEQRSGARPGGRDPQLFGDVVGRLLAERGWTKEVSVGGVIGRWRDVVGDDIADHATPLTFDEGVLVVQAGSTAWATQLEFLRPSLLGRLAEELGQGVVEELRVVGPTTRSFGRGPRRVKGRGPRDTWG